jgi:hypothetical protein
MGSSNSVLPRYQRSKYSGCYPNWLRIMVILILKLLIVFKEIGSKEFINIILHFIGDCKNWERKTSQNKERAPYLNSVNASTTPGLTQTTTPHQPIQPLSPLSLSPNYPRANHLIPMTTISRPTTFFSRPATARIYFYQLMSRIQNGQLLCLFPVRAVCRSV